MKQTPYLSDQLDRQLIALLREDGRAPISQLAKQLNVSRATVQNRLERLTVSGAILGFTIRAHEHIEKGSVKAIMMIEVVGRTTTTVIKQLRGFPELQKLHTTNGKWDLIAELQASDLMDFDRVLRMVREIEGVLNSETSILLTSL